MIRYNYNAIKLKSKELKQIENYLFKNFEVFSKILEKLISYTKKVIYFQLSDSEIKLINNIPVPEKYKLEIPVEIFRGIRLTSEIIKKIEKDLKLKKEVWYNPQKNKFSSWTMNLKVAEKFNTSRKGKEGIIFKSTLTSENKFIDIFIFQVIVENLYSSYLFKNQKTLNKNQKTLFSIFAGKNFYNEEEVLVFDKIKIDKIIY